MPRCNSLLVLLGLFLLLASDLHAYANSKSRPAAVLVNRLRSVSLRATGVGVDVPAPGPAPAVRKLQHPPLQPLRAPPFPLPGAVNYAAQGLATPFSRARNCSEARGSALFRAPGSSDACSLPSVRVLEGLEGGSGGGGGSSRSEAEVAQRLNFSAACLSLHPYSVPMAAPPLRHRAALVEHGALLNTAIMQWAAEVGLPMPQHHESLGYAGPFIEDHFREAFYLPVRHPLTLAQARAREAAVAEELFARRPHNLTMPSWGALQGLGLGTSLALVTCSGAAGCSESVYSNTSQLPFTALSAHQTLYLQVPYDSELFHPMVPLFVPWEAASVAEQMVRASMRVGPNMTLALATHQRLLERYNAAKAANASSLRKPIQPSYAPYTRALELFPHFHTLRLKDLLPRLQALLSALMRPDVYYVTVCQRPEGPWLEAMARSVIRPLLGRTLVLSSGGGGHVPLPLLARVLPLLPVRQAQPPTDLSAHPLPPLDTPRAAALQRAFSIPQPAQARYSLSLLGNLRTGARERVHGAALALLGPSYSHNRSAVAPEAWVAPFVDTRLALAPRGVGSTSFRLYEALQLGVPPVYAFDGLYPWLPYAHPATLPLGRMGPNITVPARFTSYPAALPPPPPTPSLWASAAHVVFEGDIRAALANTSAGQLPELSPDAALRDAAWWSKRRAIEAARDEHFTYEGVMAHIFAWMQDPFQAELFCSHAVPPSWDRFGLSPPPPPPSPRPKASSPPTLMRNHLRVPGSERQREK